MADKFTAEVSKKITYKNVHGAEYTGKVVAGVTYKIVDESDRGLPLDETRKSITRALFNEHFGKAKAPKQPKPPVTPPPPEKPEGEE